MRNVILMGLCAFSISAQALPMIGQSCSGFKTFKIVETEVDGELQVSEEAVENSSGVLFSEDCRTMFVLPPKVGDFHVSGLAPNSSLQLCPTMDEVLGAVNKYSVGVQKIDQKILEGELSAEERSELGKQRNEYRLNQLADLKFANEFAGYPGYTSSVLLSHEWDKLVIRYRALNPGKNVSQAPLRSSFLTATLKTKSSFDVLTEDSPMTAVESAVIPGLSGFPDFLDWVTAGSDAPTYIFGSSLGGQIKLNLAGACPFMSFLRSAEDNQEEFTLRTLNEKSVRTALLPYLVSSLTYFYPMKTKQKFSVRFHVNEFAKIFESEVRKSNVVKVSKVMDNIRKIGISKFVTVKYENNGGSTGENLLTLNELYERVVANTVDDLLSKIGNPLDALPDLEKLPPPSDPHYHVTRSSYSCSTKKIFGIKVKRSCHSRSYRVKVKTTGVGTSVVDYFKSASVNVGHEMIITDTVLNSGTLTFAN